MSIDVGTGVLNLGTNATAHEVTIGPASAATDAGVTIRANTGGIDIDCGQATGDISLDTAGGEIQLGVNAAAGNIEIGTNATARTIDIGNETGATALDLDAGTGGVTIDAQGAGIIAIGTQTDTGAINVGVGASARTITVGNDASTKVDVNALAIELDSAGTLLGTSVTTTTLTAATTMSVKGNAGASFGDDTGTWEFDGSGGLSETGMTTISMTPSSTFDVDAAGAVTIDGSAITIGGDDSGVAITLGHSTSEVSVMDNLTVHGDLSVKGTEHIIDSDHLRVKDPLIIIGSGSVSINSMSAIAFASGSASDNRAMIFGNLGTDATNTFGVGILDVKDGSMASSSLSYAKLADFRAGGYQVGGEDSTIALADATSLGVTSSGDIHLNADGGLVVFQDGNAYAMTIDMSTTAGDAIFEDGGGTEIFRIDGSENSLLMASTNKIQFTDTNAYIHHDGTDLKLADNADINLVAGADVLLDAGAEVVLDTNGAVVFKNAGTTMGHISPSGNDLLFEDDGQTEIFRLDSSENSLLMASTNKIQFTDSSAYINHDGTDLQLVDNADINLKPAVNLLVDAGQNIILDSGAGNWWFEDDGSPIMLLNNSSGDMILSQSTSGKDFIFNAQPSGAPSMEFLRVAASSNEVVVNEAGGNKVNFRVETDNYDHGFFVSAGNDGIGMGNITDGVADNWQAVLNISASNASVVGLSLSGDAGATAALGDFLQVLSGTAQTETLVIDNAGRLQIATGYSLSFNGGTNTAKITNNGQNLDINAPGDVVFNAGGGNVSPNSAGGSSLGAADAEWANVYVGDGAYYLGLGQEHSVADGNPGLLIDSTQVVEINSSAAAISIGNDAVAQAINIGTGAAARTITVGNDASTKVDVNALAIELDSAGSIVLNSTTTTTLDSTTGMSLDAGAASNFSTSAGDLTLDSAAGSLVLDSGESSADSVRVVASHAAGGIDMDSGTGGYNNTTTGILALTSSLASEDQAIRITTSGEESSIVVESAFDLLFAVGAQPSEDMAAMFVLSGTLEDGSAMLAAYALPEPGHSILVIGPIEPENVTPDDGGGTNGSLLIGSSSMNGFSNLFASGENGVLLRTGGEDQGQLLGISGSTIRLGDDYAYGSNLAAEGVELASSRAEYNTFYSNFGDSSLVGAINSAKTSSSGRTAKEITSISATVASGTAQTVLTSDTIRDVSSDPKRIDLFVNGQLLRSGTDANVGTGAADYVFSTDTAIKLGFALASDDLITTILV